MTNALTLTFQETYGLVKHVKNISRTTPVLPGHECEIKQCMNTVILLRTARETGLFDWWYLGGLHRDHCHIHGWIRGFACPACNLALAFQEQFTPSKNTQAFDILWKAESKGFPWNPNNGNVVIDVPEYLKLCPECK